MKHVVMFSGGVGSCMTAKRVAEAHGSDDTILLFADTMMEDEDLYRFLEAASDKLGVSLERIADGRTPWQVFNDQKFMGNSRVDLCSRILKRELLDRWVEEKFTPDEVVCYVGIDWTEIHRFERMAPRKLPYIYKAPMCDPPLLMKPEMLEALYKDGIAVPRLYSMGFPHNNCGGFCVKAGQGHFKMLLDQMPERYAYHEEQERLFREKTGKNVSVMKDRRGGQVRPLTMKDLRLRSERNEEIDMFDLGGCGCAID